MVSSRDLSFEALFEGAPDAMLVVDGEGRITRTNERTLDLFGYTPDELEGELIERLVPAPKRDDHVALRNRYLAEPTRRPMGAGLELVAERKDGSTVPVDICLTPVGDDGDSVLAAVRDVSSHRRLERRYRTLLETIPDAVVVAAIDDGEIVDVNKAATDLFGRSRSNLLGSTQDTLHPADQLARYRALFERHVTGDESLLTAFPDGEDILIETEQGRHVPVAINARTARLGEEAVVLGVFRDISEQRARERELQRQLDRLETLARIISHDLRGPLNVASGYLDRIRTADEDALAAVADAHDRMAEIIDDVLTMLRSTGDPALEPVRLGALARECWSAVAAEAGTLVVDDDVVVEADPQQLRHIVENLFRNAVVHGGEDVTVRLGGLPVDAGFYVADDGPGIPEEHRERVYEPGYSTHVDGTGFGLVIVREMAAAHGWAVSVTEGRTGGARFEFTNVDIVD